MKNHDKLSDWLQIEEVEGGSYVYYVTYSYETDLSFVLRDFFKRENTSDNPDSTTVFSLFRGEPDEAKVEECLRCGMNNTIPR